MESVYSIRRTKMNPTHAELNCGGEVVFYKRGKYFDQYKCKKCGTILFNVR